jgi:hypothetical protein
VEFCRRASFERVQVIAQGSWFTVAQKQHIQVLSQRIRRGLNCTGVATTTAWS